MNKTKENKDIRANNVSKKLEQLEETKQYFSDKVKSEVREHEYDILESYKNGERYYVLSLIEDSEKQENIKDVLNNTYLDCAFSNALFLEVEEIVEGFGIENVLIKYSEQNPFYACIDFVENTKLEDRIDTIKQEVRILVAKTNKKIKPKVVSILEKCMNKFSKKQ